MKKLAILAALACLSAAASATGPLIGGDTTNNYNTTNAPSAVGNGYGGAGGQGGQGGAGGRGGDGGNATVLGSGNSSNANLNTNTNLQGQAQGQAQGQNQSIKSSNNASSASGGNTFGTGAVGQSVAVDARNQSVYQAQERNPVNSAYSAGLTSSNGTCMGSSSIGLTGPGFSATGGTTWKDSDCSKRYTAEALRASGLNSVAMGVLCQIGDVKAAAPKMCNDTAKQLGSVSEETPAVAATASPAPVGSKTTTDPYIAASGRKYPSN